MCFYFPCLDSFFKKKEDIVCDDDGSMSSMPSLYDLHFSARMIGVNIVPNKAPHSFDTLVYTDDVGGDDIVVDLLNDDGGDGGIIGGDDVVDLLGGDYVVVDLLSCDDYVVVNLPCDDDNDDDNDDDDDDDGDKDGGLVWNKPRPPWNRYHAMLMREKERCLDVEFSDLYLYNRKKQKIVVLEFLILGMIFGMVIGMIRKIAMIMHSLLLKLIISAYLSTSTLIDR